MKGNYIWKIGDWKVGDVVFFAKGDSAHALEFVAEIDEIDYDSLMIKTKNCITIMKMMNSNGQMGYESINNCGLISNLSSIEKGENGTLVIDIRDFSVCGVVKNNAVLKLFEKEKSNLILLGKPNQKPILG